MQTLFTPWRFSYITDQNRPPGCFFCAAAEDPSDPERLVVHRTERFQVVLNRYPYTNGHLMVAPLEHLSSPSLLDAEGHAEFWPLVMLCQEILENSYSPGGFNMGLNLGRAAGAGVPGHFHFHLVPRWEGDTNFMTVVGGVRLVPEDPVEVRDRLAPLFRAAESGSVEEPKVD